MNNKNLVVWVWSMTWLIVVGGLILLAGGTRAVVQASPLSDVLSQPVSTTVRYVAVSGVDTGNDCANASTPCRSVQYAVDQADENDEIRVATGVYTGVHTRPQQDIMQTDVVTHVVYLSKTLTIQGGYSETDWGAYNPLSNPTTLDAEELGRVFYIAQGSTFQIMGVRMTGGSADVGGGLYIYKTSGVITDSVVFSNTAEQGAGLYVVQGEVQLSNNVVLSNVASADGGGIYLYKSNDSVLKDNVFENNRAASQGGAIYVDQGTPQLLNNVIRANWADDDGGGLYVYKSKCDLLDNEVSENEASGGGGGLFAFSSDLTLERNDILSVTVQGGVVGSRDGAGRAQLAASQASVR